MNENILIKYFFKESLKFKQDEEKLELLRIQRELEKEGITIQLVQKLTKHLSKEQRNKLIELYKNQINNLEDSLQNYKRKILEIRKKCN